MVRCQIITDRSNIREPLGRHLVFTAKAVREAFEDALAKAGGSLGTWIVLSALSEDGVVSQTILASRMQVEGATITHHVDRLEQLGLVRREIDPKDRRVRRLEVTPEGVRLHRQLLAAAKEFEGGLLAGISERQQAELRRTLDRIRANVEQPSS
jgi:MarR family transcriptional regulator, transcriptional regulator for hemolysin